MDFADRDNEMKKTEESPQTNSIYFSLCKKIRNLSASSSLKGSLTVETALSLPLFIFAVLILIMTGEAVRFSGSLNAGLMESAKTLSVYAYAGKSAGLGGKTGVLGSKAVSLTLGKTMSIKELGKNYDGKPPAAGGTGGLSFVHSNVMGADEMIDLNVVWKMKTDFCLPGINGFKVIDRARIRAFTGYDNTGAIDSGETEEEMVFVTETGTVFHRSRNCSHLNIHISAVERSNVGKMRNSGGGKYHPCEFCGGGTKECLYITEDGDRYHTKVSCPGLKRTIHTVPISKVGGKGPCSECG